MYKSIEESLTEKENYKVLNFFNAGIRLVTSLIVMYGIVIAGVSIWALYNPKIKATLLAMQNTLLGMFQ